MAESIYIKSPREIELMRKAGRVAAGARNIARDAIRSGVTTKQIDKEVHDYIVKCGAWPSFLNYEGFPGSVCVSIDEEVIHGIPGRRKIRNGEIVSIDVGATLNGFVGDCAGTFLVGEVKPEARKLVEVTKQSFFEAMKVARAGNRLFDISAAVEDYVTGFGFMPIKDYVGHGVGRKLHEAPDVPNYKPDRKEAHTGNPRLRKGMTIAVEPMIVMGGWEIEVLDDDWTVVSADGSLAAHYENTILITDGEPEILTMADDI